MPLLALLVAGEFAARWFRDGRGRSPFMTGSYRDQRIDLIRRGYPAVHDPELGYVPRPGFAGDDNQWRVRVTIDACGLRENGQPRPPGERGALAVGDSFTFGDQVGDADTWPAVLERVLGTRVWNGGVFGYSFAQTVLRAERLLPELPVDTLVVSLIPEDITRCELKKRFTPVPWYEVTDSGLRLRGVPVPDTGHGTDEDRQGLRVLLGHSALCDLLFWNTVPQWWVGDQREIRSYPHASGMGLVIAKALLERLRAGCTRRSVRLLLVLQGQRGDEPVDAEGRALLAHGRCLGVATLDLLSRFETEAAADPGLRRRCFAGHMTAAGNAWVAAQVAAALTGH